MRCATARCATSRSAGLIAGADTARRADVALTVWLVRRPDGRNVLVDAGFYREKFMTRWKPADYQQPSDAIRATGLRPEDITDVIVSHVHWDHLDGADLFPNARVWIQADGVRAPRRRLGPRARSHHRLARRGDARRRSTGRAACAASTGDSQVVMPGITVYTGGRHTFASQYATVETARGVVVLASDNAYLYENLATQTPIAQTLDSASNRAAQQRMLRLAGSPRLVVPGHDPEVFVRFPTPGHGVARIQ